MVGYVSSAPGYNFYELKWSELGKRDIDVEGTPKNSSQIASGRNWYFSPGVSMGLMVVVTFNLVFRTLSFIVNNSLHDHGLCIEQSPIDTQRDLVMLSPPIGITINDLKFISPLISLSSMCITCNEGSLEKSIRFYHLQFGRCFFSVPSTSMSRFPSSDHFSS